MQAVLPSDLYDHPDLYDALYPVRAHLSFYAGLAREQAGAVLELACLCRRPARRALPLATRLGDNWRDAK